MRVIAACLLVVAALTFPTAAGAQSTGNQAGFSSCFPAPEVAFSDISQLDDQTRAAIDCVFFYGVSRGTTDTTFSPTAQVTRLQMARFLVRTAETLGLELPENPTAPFTDVASLGEEARRSVATLYQLRITRGSTPETFDPRSNVSRGQMALFLYRTLNRAQVSFGQTTDTFTDLANSSQELQRAAGQLAAAGIMPGLTSTEFGTRPAVTRADMALFLARTLDQADLLPVRLTITIDSDRLSVAGSTVATVTATRPNGDPFPGLLIDVFAVRSLGPGGVCRLDVDARINGLDGGTSVDCQIDRADPRTNSDGQVVVGLSHGSQPTVNTIYAWTGEIGDVFNANDVRNETSARVAWLATPNQLVLTAPDQGHFGQSIQISAVLTGSRLSQQRVVLEVIRDGAVVFTSQDTVSGRGTATFTYTGPSRPGRDESSIEEIIRVFWDRNGNGIYDGPAEFSSEIPITWAN